MFNHYTNLYRKRAEGILTFDDLITKIRTINPAVEFSRKNHIKGTDEYQDYKQKFIEAFSTNCFNKLNYRNSKYLKSSGYIYVDVDHFKTKEDAIEYRQQVISKLPFVAACWLSVSNLGLSILIKVEKCNAALFLKCYDVIKTIIPEIDTRVIDYKRLCNISYDPDVYVNKSAVAFNVMHKIESDGLNWKTQIPDSEFKDVNSPAVYPDGRDYLEINPHGYKNTKIKVGDRNKILGCVSMQLLYLNPNAEFNQILNAINQFNKNYCEKELPEKEVLNLVKNNFEKKDKLDVSKYLKRKQVFFHKLCQLPRPIRMEIINEEKRKINTTLIEETIYILQKQGVKPTIPAIAGYTSFSKSKVHRLMGNVHFSHQVNIYNSYNMQEWENRTFDLNHTQQRIYEAIEELQGCEKITLHNIAYHLAINEKTVRRNMIPEFKEFIKTCNKELKETPAVEVDEFTRKRDILSSIPNDIEFERLILNLQNSKLYDYSSTLKVA